MPSSFRSAIFHLARALVNSLSSATGLLPLSSVNASGVLRSSGFATRASRAAAAFAAFLF